MSPEIIDRYEIRREIGRGGMATVYLAHDPRVERDVAIKVLPSQFLHDPKFRGRFQQEAQAIAALEHSAIVPIYDFGEYEDQPFLVMRYMPGGSLTDRLEPGPLSVSNASQVLNRIASAIDKAHAQQVIHRDLKPANILFDSDGEAYLSDFGIAKLQEGTASFTGSAIIGTPAYMSPEQARGKGTIDARSDIYALGAVLFKTLTGKVPYEADTPVGQAIMHINEPVPRVRDVRPEVPQAVADVIKRAMAKDPAGRYRSARAMAQALHRAHGTIPSGEDPPTFDARPTALPVDGRRWGWAVAGVLLLAALGWGVYGAANPGIIEPTEVAALIQPEQVDTPTPELVLLAQTDTAQQTEVAAYVAGTNTAVAKERAMTSAVAEPSSTATLTPALTRTATSTPAPTASPTASATATPTATMTPTNIPTPALAKVDVDMGNLRSGPGTVYSVVANLDEGTELTPLERTPGANWFRVEVVGTGVQGWISTTIVDLNFVAGTLPVAQEIPPTPIPPTATPIPPATTAPTPGPVISFVVDNNSINYGECTTIRWDVENISGVYFQDEGVTGHETRQVCPTNTTTYSLRVDHAGGVENREITLDVIGAPAGPTSGEVETKWFAMSVRGATSRANPLIGSYRQEQAEGIFLIVPMRWRNTALIERYNFIHMTDMCIVGARASTGGSASGCQFDDIFGTSAYYDTQGLERSQILQPGEVYDGWVVFDIPENFGAPVLRIYHHYFWEDIAAEVALP